ncbi:hypothetical protein X797_006432 [Metarhizium robertsii]|uniref:Uncharacterized protein n=1 Tax=Metarhizium robertsii TaxID=568076 RepID=A0A014NEE9_9HYPO|nr:hypothetical protein X797_006432 [Metarhizium robertsii]
MSYTILAVSITILRQTMPLALLADIIRHTFDDAETLETFRSTFIMTFEMDVGLKAVFSALPRQNSSCRYRIFLVLLARENVVSCRLDQGRLYSERWSDGVVREKTLYSRGDIFPAPVVSLQIANFHLDSDPLLDAPRDRY